MRGEPPNGPTPDPLLLSYHRTTLRFCGLCVPARLLLTTLHHGGLAMRPLVLILLAAGRVHGAAMPPVATAPTTPWRVEDLRVGMKGIGKTVMKGTRVETFDAELLGVLKNS